MKLEDMILVSVDDHVCEPANMWENHLPAKWKDHAPRLVHKPDGTDVWVFEGRQIPNVGLNAVAGRPPEEYGMEPTSLSQLRPGCYDIHARIQDMNANGVLGSLCFPSVPGFTGELFAKQEDKEMALAMLRAYNDWHIDEWAAAYPGRIIPLALPAMWDPKLMAEEVHRVARKGCHAITFADTPTGLGYPSLHSDHWEPFWRACDEEGTVVCIHIGSGTGMNLQDTIAPVEVMIASTPISLFNCAMELVYSKWLRKYRNLKIALSEGGTGWVPYFLERIDYVYEHHHHWTHQDFGKKRPSDVFREHILTCFIDDAVGVRNRDLIGIDNLTWECDYPHSDSTWPRAPEILWKSFEGVPDADIQKITHQNVMKHFQYDPFRHLPREQCTVRALRAQARGWDVSQKSVAGSKPPSEYEQGFVTVADIMKQMATAFATPFSSSGQGPAADPITTARRQGAPGR
jgi:predicted TIM-barrel fold metal-dependent hydrolase